MTGKLDYAGALAAVVFLSGITFAFIEAPTLGWTSPTVITMALLGVAGLAAFLARFGGLLAVAVLPTLAGIAASRRHH